MKRFDLCEQWQLFRFRLLIAAHYLFTHFHDFSSQIGVVILVTPKQEVEWKNEWFYGVKFFRSKFKVEWENGVWTKIGFLASGFLFTCGNFTWIFTVFFDFFGSVFFLNRFPNPFIVRSRSSVLFSQMKILGVVRQCKYCPAMFFYLVWLIFVSSYPDFFSSYPDLFNDFGDFYCFAVKICVRDVLKIWWSICQYLSLVVSIHCRPQASIAAIFRQNCRLCISDRWSLS